MKMLQTITSLQPTFIYVDTLDTCVEGNQSVILDALRQILENSTNTRIFLTARQHVGGDMGRHLSASAIISSIKL